MASQHDRKKKHAEKSVSIAAKFYDARKSLIGILGVDRFRAKVDEYRPVMQMVMHEHKKSEMEATIIMLKLCGDDGMQMMMVMATCCEIMEPSLPDEKKPK